MENVKNLEKLLKCTDINYIVGDTNKEITDITADSREVKEGSLFICLDGVHVDGHNYAASAAQKGAAAIVASREIDVPEGTTVVYVTDTRKAMEDITPFYFDYPARRMRMIAVTGTNGKTTSTHIIAHILRKEGYKVGVIGTIHWLINDEEHPIHNTTPDVITLQKILFQMAEAGVTHVSMEVSSHSLVSSDEHNKPLKSGIINADDPYAHVMKEAVHGKTFCPVFTYAIDHDADLRAVNIHFSSRASVFDLKMDGVTYTVHTNLAGRFNVYNTLAAIAAALSEGVRIDHIISALAEFQACPGRFELINEGQPFGVVVDYAHTPDGLENILKTAKEITKGRILVVFGCGGDRDRKKRPIMGAIAAKYSDIAIITSDNPRSEDPNFIISEVEDGVRQEAKNHPAFHYEVIAARRQAIERAIRLAEAEDIVLIAGKGHETYQILKDKTIHFDDREEARKAIRECK